MGRFLVLVLLICADLAAFKEIIIPVIPGWPHLHTQGSKAGTHMADSSSRYRNRVRSVIRKAPTVKLVF